MTEKYIKASECEKYFYEHLDDLHMTAAMNAIDEMPNEDVAPVRHGYWVNTTTDEEKNEMSIYTCSICGNNWVLDVGLTPKDECIYYCSYCGAKMDEKECDSK